MVDSVEVRKALDGGYWLTARTDTLSEAMWGVDVLLAKSSEAFDAMRTRVLGPCDFPEAPSLTPEQEARIAAADPPDPIDVLNVDKPLSLPGEVGN